MWFIAIYLVAMHLGVAPRPMTEGYAFAILYELTLETVGFVVLGWYAIWRA